MSYGFLEYSASQVNSLLQENWGLPADGRLEEQGVRDPSLAISTKRPCRVSSEPLGISPGPHYIKY
jgi:hypothetical protein